MEIQKSLSYCLLLLLMLTTSCQHREGQLRDAQYYYRQADSMLSAHKDAKAVASLIASVDCARKAAADSLLFRSEKKLGEVLSDNGLYLQTDSVYDRLEKRLQKSGNKDLQTAITMAQCDNLVLGNIALHKAEHLLLTMLASQKTSTADTATAEKCYYLLSTIYKHRKQIRKTITASRMGLMLTKDNQHRECYINTLQKCYSDLSMNDSSAYFMRMSMKSSADLISSIYVFKMPNHKKSMCIVYKDIPSLSGATERKESNKAVQQVLDEYNRSQRLSMVRTVLACAGLALLVLAGFVSSFFWKRHKQRSRKINELASEVDELKKNSLTIDYQKSEAYQNLKKLAQSNYEQVDNPLPVSEGLWDQLYATIDEHNPNYLKGLKSEYEVVSDEEIHLCCLLHIGLTYLDIAHLYGCTKQAIYKRRDTLIRHSPITSKKEFAEIVRRVWK